MNDYFKEIVIAAFHFLEERYGFRVVEANKVTVIYESSVVTVALFYDDQRSFEIGLSINLRNSTTRPPYSFDELLKSQRVPEGEWAMGFSAQTHNQMQKLVERMADVISLRAVPLLEGQDLAWNRLVEQRRQDCLAYASDTNLKHARSKAESAWVKKNYAEVVESLEVVRPLLGKAELAKLEYAKRAVGLK